jgi:alpha-glucosidase
MTEPWYDGAVMYQVYPRSHADTNGDGIGDLPGVAAHLDHVSGPDGLGVEAIWLSPFYPHGGVDGGYDVTDHTAVSPEYGRLTDVDHVLARAHELGLRVILDLVAGHTSDHHPWFLGARASRTDPRRDWFLWADGRDGGPPSNWVAEWGGSAWTHDSPSGQWFHHSFYPEQPDLNWRNPAVRAAMAQVMRFWLDRGVDGFRLDAMQYLLKDTRLRDNPPALATREPWGAEPGGLRRRWTRDQRGIDHVVRSLRRVSDAYPGTILLGELYGPADRVAAAFGGARGDGVHLALDHQLAKSDWDAGAFRRAIAAAERHLPAPRAPTWAFSNHDLSRHATRWGVGRTRVAALILLTLRGTVSLYQGEEIGMVDVAPGPRSAPSPWSTNDRAGRDPARSPVDWAEVARQQQDPDSLLALYRALMALRRASPALRHGTLSLLRDLPSGVLGYERAGGAERLLVLANMRSAPARVRLPVAGDPELIISTATPGEPKDGQLVLGPDEGVLLRLLTRRSTPRPGP